MLYDDNVNITNSFIKGGVDAWYKHYILDDYDDYIEDTIFCNDRSLNDFSTSGWNPNGGSIINVLHFKEYNTTSDLSCTNDTDKFSVSNNKAKLTYKVGLLSSPEMNILNSNNTLKTEQMYWLNSPYFFDGSGQGVTVYADGEVGYDYFSNAHGVRPAISLIPGIRYSDGDGSMANPYIVSTE